LKTEVRRDWSCFDNTTQQFKDDVCAAMDVQPQSWTGVSRIRLVRTPSVAINSRHFIELVLPGRHVRVESFELANLAGWTSRHDFALSLTGELHLRHAVHAVVAGVDEYAV